MDILILVFIVVVIAAIAIPSLLRSRMSASHNNAGALLKQLVTVEGIWKSKDLDRNGVNDFWTKDIRGFYGIHDASGKPVQLIERRFAWADYNPGFGYDSPADVTRPVRQVSVPPGPKGGFTHEVPLWTGPMVGCYFIAMSKDQDGKAYIDTKLPVTTAAPASGHCTNAARFGFTAYTSVYNSDGILHFMVGEDGVVWQKDIHGVPVTDRSAGPPPGSDTTWAMFGG